MRKLKSHLNHRNAHLSVENIIIILAFPFAEVYYTVHEGAMQ
jgi:hypothetical protein